MDTNIRNLLNISKNCSGVKRHESLEEMVKILRSVADQNPKVDGPDSFSPDLFVQSAEVAFSLGEVDTASECLRMYFLRPVPTNQFFGRAYLLQAQILAPPTAANPDQLDKALVYLLKAIKFAKNNTRYHFLVYNSSVIYWQFCRPFLKPNYRQYLAKSLHQVVKALDDIEDEDYEWRATLMIALIECHLDAGRHGDASNIAGAAATFIRQYVPHLYNKLFALIIRYKLVDSAKLQKDLKVPELSVLFKIGKLKAAIESGEAGYYQTDIHQLLTQLGVSCESIDPTDLGAMTHDSKVTKKNRSIKSPDEDRKSPVKTGAAPMSTKKVDADSADRCRLLLEVARMASSLKYVDMATLAADNLATHAIKDASLQLEVEFLQSELMVRRLGTQEESYSPSAVDLRLKAIRRCEASILNAVRQSIPNVIQGGCVTQWNLCLPLLQPKTRYMIRKHLGVIADALQNIDSLLMHVRCQIHMELALCEEEQEQIQVAIEHLNKAVTLDESGTYNERLQAALHRLRMRSLLYEQPERNEDVAAMIIEQARKADSGTLLMKRSLLVKAGESLAPDSFLLVLQSELIKELSGGKGEQIEALGSRVQQFNRSVEKAAGHLKRLGNENDRERARLWADLTKTARKQEIWDVCRVASRFCLLYDDGRWKDITQPIKIESSKLKGRSDTVVEPSENIGVSHTTSPDTALHSNNRGLLSMLAEINFINGEALIQLLRGENVELNNKPIPPEDKSKKPKGYVAQKIEENTHWIAYCQWISSLCEAATNSFLRALKLGLELREEWIVCNATTYVYNYNNHVLCEERHREIREHLSQCFEALKTVGHSSEATMLVHVANALCLSYIKPWIVEKVCDNSPSPTLTKGKKVGTASGKPKPTMKPIDPDGLPDIKRALEVCDHVLQVTSGDSPSDIVPIYERSRLLQTWALAKQMAQAPISKAFGTDDETNNEGQRMMTRAIVAMEMHFLNRNGMIEFRETPSLQDAARLIEETTWSDTLLELQLWSRLSYLAHDANMPDLVKQCTTRALRFATDHTFSDSTTLDKRYKRTVECEMLSAASGILGQSLFENMKGRQTIRREALEAFLNSARFASKAKNRSMLMNAARHYWNACLPLLSSPIEREVIREPIKFLLTYIQQTTPVIKKIEESSEGQDDNEDQQTKEGLDISSTLSEELTLQAALYGVLFQSYVDKEQWQEGLEAMDQALTVMPRTKHRLLIYKHRVMVKAKLGLDVHVDIAKFRDESEDDVAQMWRRVALSSKETPQQLHCYQQAITSLTSSKFNWQKIDYILEFAQWLYVNNFPLQDVIDQLEWAADIVLQMEHGAKKADDVEKKESKRSKLLLRSKHSKSAVSQATSHTTEKASSTISRDTPVSSATGEPTVSAGDFIPVEKEAVIGIPPGSEAISIDDICDIRQLDTLFRVHVLMAEVVGQSSPMYTKYCILAHGYLMAIWKVSLSESGSVLKEVVRLAQAEPAVSPRSANKSAKAKKGKEKGLAKEVPKDKPKRKGLPDQMPETTVDWSTYDVPEEVLESFQHDLMKTAGVNVHTITKPELTLHYINQLTEMLREIGYLHLTLPVLAFADLLSRSLINKKPLQMLVHLRAMRVCTELNLIAGLKFHEEIVGNHHISDADQAASREEVAICKEKRTQVKNEEARLKKAMKELSAEKLVKSATFSGKSRFSSKQVDDGQAENGVISYSHLGQRMGDFRYIDVWTDIASELISQGLYQTAMDYLTEAYTAAKAYEDKHQQAKILMHMADVAFYEAQYGRARKLFISAQEMYNGVDVYWHEATVKVADAILKDKTEKSRHKKALNVLIHAMNVFNKMAAVAPSRQSTIQYITATLEAKIATTQVSAILSEVPDTNSPPIMRGLLSAVKRYERAIEQLLNCRHKREASIVMKEHANLLWKMARNSTEEEIKHAYYVQAMSGMKEAVSVREELYHDSLTLLSSAEISVSQNMSLPVQREMADVQILCAELMLEMFDVYISERRVERQANEAKGSVLQLVDEMERPDTPEFTYMEREWHDVNNVLPDIALSYSMNAHNAAANIPHLKAKSLFYIGKCFFLIGTHISPDGPSHWTAKQLERLLQEFNALNAGENAASSAATSVSNYTLRQTEKYVKRIVEYKANADTSWQIMMQAAECLLQSLNVSLAHQFTDIAASASLQLVQQLGQYDPTSATHLLALYQSCRASLNLEEILRAALPDPSTSRFAAVLHQRDYLLHNAVKTNATCAPVWTCIQNELNSNWQAWKRLSISHNHLELLREFPSNFNFMILQHSQDKTHLFGAIMERPKTSLVTKEKKGSAVHSRVHISRVPVDPTLLRKIQADYARYRLHAQQLLLQQQYKQAQYEQRQKMLADLGQSDVPDALSSVKTDKNEVEMEADFKDIIKDLEEYMFPLLSRMDLSSIVTGKSSTHTETSGKDCLILLADSDLLDLPLEVLQSFHGPFISSMSRDFSLQMFYHRLHVEQPPEDAPSLTDKKKASSKKDTKEVNSRIPGLKDAAKKQGKLVPVNRHMPSWCKPVDTMNIRYIVDPFSECVDTESQAPMDVFAKILTEYEQQFTPRWLGILGKDHTPSVGEWEIYMNGASGFIFYGMERFLSYLHPARLATLNLPDCMITYIADLAQTSQSFSRQAKLDVFKSPEEISLESPLHCAALLSLTGVKCVLSNQWNCSLADNSKQITSSFKDLLETGLATGDMCRLYNLPERRRALSPTGTETTSSQQPSPGSDTHPPSQNNRKTSILSVGKKTSTGVKQGRLVEKVEVTPTVERKNFNMVCYGLPNLIITQI